MARIGFCYSTGSDKVIPWRDAEPEAKTFGALTKVLNEIHRISYRRMVATPTAREEYERWYRDKAPIYRRIDLISHFWGRYRTVAKKAAMLFELSWDTSATEISFEAMKLGTALVDYHLECAKYLLSEEWVFNKTLEDVSKVEKFLREERRATERAILKAFHFDVDHFRRKVHPNLMASGKVIVQGKKYVWQGNGDVGGV